MSKRSISLMLALLLAAGTFSCGASETPAGSDTTDASSSGDTTPAEESYTRENYPDSLPALDYKGAPVRILSRNGDSYKNLEIGPDEETGDVVSDALYARNRKVEEQLNVTLEVTYGETDSTKHSQSYYNTILAGDDVYDIIQVVHNRGPQYAQDGVFVNLVDAPYLDFEKPWWNDGYMAEISVAENERYLLQGDISIFSLRNLSAMFYNKDICDKLYQDPDLLYTHVVDGTWTHDVYRKMVQDAYQDLNADGVTDVNDMLGGVGNLSTKADHYAYPAGMVLSERDSDGYPVLLADQSRNVAIAEALDKLFYQTPGFIILSGEAAKEEAQARELFINSKLMFLGDRLYNAEFFRDMRDPYGVIPMPKLDEAQKDYKALVHNSTTLYVVPITLTEIDMACAALESMCAETYRKVTPAYYDVAMKVKYSHDEMSGQVMDMLRDAMTTDFVYANSSALSNMGVIAREVLKLGAGGNYMSKYDSLKPAVETKLAEMIDKAKSLE
ncbi:MAG: hypothetical protein E7632_11120 [Ruminococcaceae bacterium]|nr:hypothetical protein [Oscillospiraceae bacterium]